MSKNSKQAQRHVAAKAVAQRHNSERAAKAKAAAEEKERAAKAKAAAEEKTA